MKLIQELSVLNEAVGGPEFILVHHEDNAARALTAAIMKKFGFKSYGTVEAMAGKAIDEDEKDHLHDLEEIEVWAAKKPSKAKVVDAIIAHSYISVDE